MPAQNTRVTCIAFFPLLLLAAASAHAFSLAPMSVSLDPNGKGATRSFTIDNNSGEKLAIQVSMAAREVNAAGVEKNPDADDDFVVYPSQIVLGGNEKRTVRVTWAGNAKPDKELAFRIIAEQLPVDTHKPDKKDQAVIRMLLRYMGAVYITPRGSSPRIEVIRLEHVKNKLAVTVGNLGTAHQIINSARIRIGSVELKDEDTKALSGLNLLAGGERRFEIAWPAQLTAENLKSKAELEIKK
ncbi:MAG: molecular chaperone [Deltaproteobacteria bacterium]|nr:molecular chaperone [Deltaproteobacteria bacterium]